MLDCRGQGKKARKVGLATCGVERHQRAGQPGRQVFPEWPATADGQCWLRDLKLADGGADLCAVAGSRHIQHDQRAGADGLLHGIAVGLLDVQLPQLHVVVCGQALQQLKFLAGDKVVVQHQHAGALRLHRCGEQPEQGAEAAAHKSMPAHQKLTVRPAK